ncbi:hypothetical protein PC119_g21463 [Phytophthora cactorum]|uniref:Uncharacterized protein n=3 Tax=Phytophthora cactorum TaxID=29920 RepID=A0A8T0YHR5_9STRA|nr:hypothetical protein PC113_g20023 [Phytophthora cactorum]KAG2979507.1 hypothetical protein PC119_g21463 [Phytophthora cactorum]KAG3159091.1 hypothetical protein PC128_g21359 [Phytophthora cactorum]
MRWIRSLCLTLAFSLVGAQGHLTTFRRYQPPCMLQHGHSSATPSTPSTAHYYRIQQLTMARRHLEALTVRLMQELRHHAQEKLQEPWYHGKCECESSNALAAPTPAPAQTTQYPESKDTLKNSSWRLESTEVSSGSTSNDATLSRRHAGSFVASTIFVLAVFFVVIPAACVIGFVLFCKRRRPQQHTHA